MEVRSGSGSPAVLVLSANGGAVVTSRAWPGALAGDLPRTCGPVAVLPGRTDPGVSEVAVIGVRVLGPLEVTVDGATADLGGPRQRSVLARLIAGHGAVISADRLIDDLYADEAPPRALAALQSYVSHLRRALEPGRAPRAPAAVLVTSPPGYAVHLGRDAVDSWSFEDEVHQAAGLDDPAAVHARLSSALVSWRGAAFQEFGGLPWADLESARLDELRLTAIEARAGAALRLGRAAEAVAGLNRLAAEHPLREEAWRLLALALYQSGRQGDALAALRRARALLAADLGVDPGPVLRELETGILAQAPHLSAPAATLPRTSVTAVPSPAARDPAPAVYVGRDAELGQVMQSALEAAAGRMRIVLVTGDAGAGKTALADLVSQRLAAQGWTVTTGRCPEHDGAPAAWPWAEALRDLARAATPADPQALAALLTDTPVRDGDAPAARFRLHRAIGGYLEAVTGTAPLLVVLDDLHRADGETLAILADVTADLAASKILVLASYRPAEVSGQLSGCLATLAAREPVRVKLGGLDAAAAGELIRAICTRRVDGETARVIAERTGGNPFFIRETARLLDSEGALAATTEVATGVREVLQRRIARLPATAQTILRQASVLGTETDIDVLSDVADVEEQVLLDAVEAALLTGLVSEPGPGRIRFAHALVRDTLYHGVSRLRRSRLHARAAEAIERHSPGEVAALAHHYAEAGTAPAKAARNSCLAAAQAEQRFAYHEAARLWEQAITCFDQAGDARAQDRLELVLGLVGALAQAGQLARARSYRHDAVRAALPLDDPVLLARVITAFDVPRAWFFRESGGTDDQLVRTVEQTLARLSAGDQPLRCRLLVTLALELADDDSEHAYQASAESVAMARRLGDPFLLTMALGGRWVQNLSFRHDGLGERLRIGADLVALPGKPVTAEALAQMMLMAARCGVADFAAADQHAGQAAHIAGRYDLPTVGAVVSIYRATRAGLDGDAAAAELYRQAAAQLDALGQAGAGLGILGRSSLLIMQDRMAEITSELEGDPRMPAMFPELYALGLAAAGRAAEARAAAARLRPIGRDRRWLFLTSIRGLLAIALGNRQRAESAYQALLPYAARPAGADTMLITLWPVAQILGDLARHLDLPAAEAHYGHALAIAEQAHAKPWREAAIRRLD
jgi:DNA-binding SARP family transcriptional activator